MDKLSDKQELFCQEYIKDLNIFAAMVRAGYSETYAKSLGYKILENIGIQNKVSELKKERAEKLNIDAEWMLKKLIAQVETNVLDAFQVAQGGLVYLDDLKKLPLNVQMCIKKVKQTKDGVEIQFEDKQKALEMIGRHIGFFEADNKLTINLEDSPVNRMPEEKAREFAKYIFNEN